MKRYIFADVKRDLKNKMVFIGGPRQVGKTTLALTFLRKGNEEHPAYLNWDFPDIQPQIIKGILPGDENLVIFDEIHKYKNWRNLIKGIYDKNKSNRSFLITGSARLDYYRRGGDSLQGRYHYYRLHPFSLLEINKQPSLSVSDTNQLIEFGGFPEPFLKANKIHWQRWQRERIKRVIHEDINSLENVKDIDLMLLLAQILPDRVGLPLSIKSLKEDLNVAHETVDKWIRIFENLYFCYRIPPFGYEKIRAVKKEQKLYFWDWSLCKDIGSRFENMVASNLLKYCHYIEDTQGFEMELRYIRDVDKREIDFVVLKNNDPLFAVECKTGAGNLSRHIKYFAERKKIPKFYQVHLKKNHFDVLDYRAEIIPFNRFCLKIKLP